jgi:adenylosuccinate lyase
MHAAPDTWGHRVADLALAADRARARLHRAASEAAIAKISGPVGTYVHVTPEIERLTAVALGLRPAEVATQVVMRDRLSEWVFALALAGSVCECVALEVRHGQRSEVNELAEGFRAGQKGSSAMPHKRNPITSEKICGLARVLRSYVVPVMEGIALWHERDISHSSVERICLPDSAMVTEHMLTSTVSLVDELQVNSEQMERTLAKAGETVFSDGAVVVLTAAGMRREAAHALVQRATESDPTGRSFARQVRVEAVEAGVEVEDGTWEDLFAGSTRADLDAVFERVAALLPSVAP